MSDPDNAPLPPLPERDGCLTALMVLVGIVLLLPGLCAVILGVGYFRDSQFDSSLMAIILLCLLVGFGGIMLIRAAIRGPRR
jgi:hypothetical protein